MEASPKGPVSLPRVKGGAFSHIVASVASVAIVAIVVGVMSLQPVTVGRARSAPAFSKRAVSDEREPDLPVEAYPSLRTAAKLIGVSPSTLSRRGDVVRVSAANQERIPAGEVVRLAAIYRRARVSRVAAELVERAGSAGTEVQELIGAEVDRAMERVLPVLSSASDVAAFIAEARRRLPKGLAAQVEATCKRDVESGHSTVGWTPEES